MLTLKLAFRSLFRHKGRTGLTLTAIGCGVVGLILSGGFVEDIFSQLREFTIRSRLGHLQVYHLGYNEFGQRKPFEYMIDDPAPLQEAISGVPTVNDVMKRLNFSGLLNTGRGDAPILGEGIEPEKEARFADLLQLVEGRQLGDDDDFHILVGEGVARAHSLSPGDYVTLLTNTSDGALNSLEFQVVGVFKTFSKDYDARAVRIPLPMAQELLLTPAVHSFVVSLNDTQLTDDTVEQLLERLDPEMYEVRTWYELDDFYPKTVALYKRQFGVFQIIILIMVALSVANSVNMTIFERVGELGVIRTLGFRTRKVVQLLMVENGMLGLLGSSIGVGVGLGLALLISKVGITMPPPPNSELGYTAQIQLVPVVIVMAFVTGMIATILPALWAARRASRVPLVEALGQNI